MIEILKSPKHVVAFKFSGSLTAEDVDKAYKATEEALKKHERISFFGEIDESMSFTFEGLVKDLLTGLGQLGKLSRYYRAAVVTGKGWIGTMARVEGLVFSSIQIRVFPPEERDNALKWASAKPEPLPQPEEPEPSLHILQTSSDKVFAYEINGRVREKDIKAAVDAFKPFIERDGKINVLVRLKAFSGFDLLSVFDDQLLRLKFKSLAKVERYAVIGAPTWMQNLMELISGLFSTKIRFFDADDEAAAWDWVGAQPTLLPE